MKKFLTFCARQELTFGPYEATDNPRLHYGPVGQSAKATRFPILAAMYGYTDPGDTIEVLAVVEDRPDCQNNAALLEEEVQEFCAERNVTLRSGKVVQIPIPNDEGIDTLLKAFQAIIENIEDQDVIHACITYSTKTNMITELMALRYARMVKKDTFIECVVYGDMNFQTKKKRIRDVTPLVQLDDILRMITHLDLQQPEKKIRELLHL